MQFKLKSASGVIVLFVLMLSARLLVEDQHKTAI